MFLGYLPITLMQFGHNPERKKRGDNDESRNGSSVGVEQDNHGSL